MGALFELASHLSPQRSPLVEINDPLILNHFARRMIIEELGGDWMSARWRAFLGLLDREQRAELNDRSFYETRKDAGDRQKF